MNSARDTPRAAQPSGLPRRTRLLLTLLTVFVGIPLILFAWIGGVLLVEGRGSGMSSTQVLAWILAVITGVVVWPLALRRLHRKLRSRQRDGVARAPGPGDADDIPARATGDVIVRAIIVLLGAVGIIALSGPLDIVATLASAGATVSIGPRENGLLLQLVATVVIFFLGAPALIVTQRALGRMPPDDPRRPAMEERQNWHVAAATAWVVSLLVGYLLSLATLITR